MNVTDPESRILKRRGGFVQGYNGQVAATVDQIVIAAEVVRDADDQNQLMPMIDHAQRTLEQIDAQDRIEQVLADGGYGTEADFADAEKDPSMPELYVAITSGYDERQDRQRAPVADPESARGRMLDKMRTDPAREIYKQRCHAVETVFGHQQTGLRFSRFTRRGLAAVRSEWWLVNAAHNLKKLHHAATRTPKLA